MFDVVKLIRRSLEAPSKERVAYNKGGRMQSLKGIYTERTGSFSLVQVFSLHSSRPTPGVKVAAKLGGKLAAKPLRSVVSGLLQWLLSSNVFWEGKRMERRIVNKLQD